MKYKTRGFEVNLTWTELHIIQESLQHAKDAIENGTSFEEVFSIENNPENIGKLQDLCSTFYEMWENANQE